MTVKKKIDKLTIQGFKSIRSLENFEMRDINVLIGANGVGKSNFVSYFRMLRELIQGKLQTWVGKQDYANHILTYGVKKTSQLVSTVFFDNNGYHFTLEPTNSGGFIFSEEKVFFDGDYARKWESLGSGHNESRLKIVYDEAVEHGLYYNIPGYVYSAIRNWKVFHFHDTSDSAGIKQPHNLIDNAYLRTDASNLAPYLYRLYRENQPIYQQIRKISQLAIPFFDDFVFNPESSVIKLAWQQRGIDDYPFDVNQLSDGSLRFICLTTALLQPDPPSTIIIDEPELGLHPYALNLLGALVRSASTRMQVILSTQSVPLLNEFELEDLIVVEREDGVSTFKRLDSKDFELWLEDYTIGQLWEKNVLGGRP